MVSRKLPLGTQVRQRLAQWWSGLTAPGAPCGLQRPEPGPQDTQQGEMARHGTASGARPAEPPDGFVAMLTRMLGISRTEGRELIQDLKPVHVKCRSATLGAPRSNTGTGRTYTHRASAVLAARSDGEEVDRSVEEIRSLTRAAIIDIITNWR